MQEAGSTTEKARMGLPATLFYRFRKAAKALKRFGAIAGPGIIVMVADNDAGGITTYTTTGAKCGDHLSWLWSLLGLVLVARPGPHRLADDDHRIHRHDGGDEHLRRACVGHGDRLLAPDGLDDPQWQLLDLGENCARALRRKPDLHPGRVHGASLDQRCPSQQPGAPMAPRGTHQRAVLPFDGEHRHHDRPLDVVFPAELGGG